LPRFAPHAAAAVLLTALTACSPDYSPNTYAARAAQQANKVEQGVVIGVRPVSISADNTVGAATGGAAGGVAGSQTPGGIGSAFGAIGGALLGGLIGSAAEHATSDVKAFEYIVKTTKGDLLSVTQREKVPLAVGQKVLLITGNQARIVVDYTVATTEPAAPSAQTEPAAPPDLPVPVTSAPLPPPQSAVPATPSSNTQPVPAASPTPMAGPSSPLSGTAVGAPPNAQPTPH
jgi:outer membrane lipoprotein SlyB